MDLKFCMRPHLTKLTTTQHNLSLINLFGTKILLRQLTTIPHNFNLIIFWGGGTNPRPRVNPTQCFDQKLF